MDQNFRKDKVATWSVGHLGNSAPHYSAHSFKIHMETDNVQSYRVCHDKFQKVYTGYFSHYGGIKKKQKRIIATETRSIMEKAMCAAVTPEWRGPCLNMWWICSPAGRSWENYWNTGCPCVTYIIFVK